MKRISHIIGRFKFILEHPLNKDRSLLALVRFFSWQALSRISRGDLTYKWINETKFKISKGESGLSINIYTGLQEFSEMAFVLHFLRREDLFLDVGANLGSYTLLASSTVGSRSIAIEPHPHAMNRLRENVELNNISDRVKFVQKAVGPTQSKTRLTMNLDTMNHLLLDNFSENSSIEVDVETIDNICENSTPALVKMDVEGYEFFAIQGGNRVFNDFACKALIVEINSLQSRYHVSSDEIMDLIKSFGFQPFEYRAFERELIALPGLNVSQGNTLFIRDLDFVSRRIKNSETYDYFGKTF